MDYNNDEPLVDIQAEIQHKKLLSSYDISSIPPFTGTTDEEFKKYVESLSDIEAEVLFTNWD